MRDKGKGLFEERIRSGESTEAFVRRALRKIMKEGVMNIIRDPSRGTAECRNTPKKSLRKTLKKDAAERRRVAEEARKRKRQRHNRNEYLFILSF